MMQRSGMDRPSGGRGERDLILGGVESRRHAPGEDSSSRGENRHPRNLATKRPRTSLQDTQIG